MKFCDKFLRNSAFFVIVIMLVFLNGKANAQSFEDAYIAVLEVDPRIKAAISSAKGSEFGIEEAYAERHPQAEAAASYDIISAPNDRTRTVELTLNQPLYKFGYYDALVNSSIKHKNFLGNNVNVIKQQLFQETAFVYTQILLGKKILRTELEREKDLRQRLEAIANEVTAGIRDGHQLNLTEAYVQRAKVDRFRAENEIVKSEFRFKRLTGIKPSNLDEKTLRKYLDNMPKTSQDAVRIAEAFSPEITEIKLDYQRQNLQLETQKGVDLPSLDLYTRYRYGIVSGTERDDVYFGLRFSLPIYRGGISVNRNRRLDNEIDANQKRRTYDTQIAYEGVLNAWLDYQSGLQDINYLGKALESSQERINKLEEVLSINLESLANFLEAKTQYYDIYKSLVYAKYEHIIRGYTLLRSIGFAKL